MPRQAQRQCHFLAIACFCVTLATIAFIAWGYQRIAARGTLPPSYTAVTYPVSQTVTSTPVPTATSQDNTTFTLHEDVTAANLAQLDSAWLPLLHKLEQDGFAYNTLVQIFSRLGKDSYSPAFMGAKLKELHGIVSHPPTPWQRPSLLLPNNYTPPLYKITTQECLAFLQKYTTELQDIQQKYGVPQHIIIAIMLVETAGGKRLGHQPALRVLASMAATSSPELLHNSVRSTKQLYTAAIKHTLHVKSAWAYEELKALLHYIEATNTDPATLPGSIYGAIGICQFMPSTLLQYGVDGDGDGKVDPFSPVDAMYSIAHFLAAHGWAKAKSKSAQQAIIMRYNYSWHYSAYVLAVASHIHSALQGKKALSSCPLTTSRTHFAGVQNPSLRRKGPITRAGKIEALHSYKDLIQ